MPAEQSRAKPRSGGGGGPLVTGLARSRRTFNRHIGGLSFKINVLVVLQLAHNVADECILLKCVFHGVATSVRGCNFKVSPYNLSHEAITE